MAVDLTPRDGLPHTVALAALVVLAVLAHSLADRWTMVRVAINGFGRIGRLTFRFAWDMPEVEIVAVNEILGGAETAAYLVKYDSVHGIWNKEVEATGKDAFTVDGTKVNFSESADFTAVDWKGMGMHEGPVLRQY